MARHTFKSHSQRRRNSGSTIRAHLQDAAQPIQSLKSDGHLRKSVKASLSIHNDAISRDAVLLAESFLVDLGLHQGDLVEVRQLSESTAVRDFETQTNETRPISAEDPASQRTSSANLIPTYLHVIKSASNEQHSKQQTFEVSINKQIATTFGFTSPAQVTLTRAEPEEWTSSHVEICFRDAYLSRSDMWRFACQELVGKPVYIGQKLSFINSLRATVRDVHINGKNAQLAYFGKTTVPVFRSEAARYVIFIQMSREMWDFDSEGNGEILFNKVVNGFLPELFKRWSNMEVRHLVSIVMFGRLEYRNSDMMHGLSAGFADRSTPSINAPPVSHQDFYRVVVTDMASAQWTTILNELKRDFRVFLRDVSLFEAPNTRLSNPATESQEKQASKITGQLSGALKGNVLEAINLAASQFSNDYIDRDLIRTGISTVVITAGSGVFDVDRDLLKLTSETLTNNGIGIDVVCLSRMPLHSVPLFRYRLRDNIDLDGNDKPGHAVSPASLSSTLPHPSLPDLSASPAFSSTNASLNYFSRFPAAFPTGVPQVHGYGIPQWIDLSYWSSEMGYEKPKYRHKMSNRRFNSFTSDEPFVPRLRMYELQMMGLMEMGMADIAIPYLSERSTDADVTSSKWRSRMSEAQYSRSLSQSPELRRRSPMASMRMKRSPLLPRDANPATNRTLALMEQYDSNVFATTPLRAGQHRKVNHIGNRVEDKISHKAKDRLSTTQGSAPRPVPGPSRQIESDRPSDNDDIASSPAKPIRPARAPRIFSYSSKGLMPIQTKASVAAAEVQTENIKAQKSFVAQAGESSDESRPKSVSKGITSIQSSKLEMALRAGDDSPTRPSTATQSDEGSRPIRISKNSGRENQHEESLTKHLWQQRQHQRHQFEAGNDQNEDSQQSDSDDKRSDKSVQWQSTPSSVPKSKIPFITNVNASNPLKRQSDVSAFGRWQHLYPRKPRVARMKWRSLCTPASVPLTSEDFPSRKELDSDYDVIRHQIVGQQSLSDTEDSRNNLFMVFLEMVSLRIAHGYQFVVGKAVSEAVGEGLSDCYALCEPTASEKQTTIVVLTMGNTIQKLELTKSVDLKITKYVQKQEEVQSISQSTINYCPYIRTILSGRYFPRQLMLRGFSERYPWEAADKHLASNNNNVSETDVDVLRYWRARFVLIPVEPPASTWKKQQVNENDEEIHLLGIRALTQLWQRNRYISPEERTLIQSRMGTSKRIDENPLEVRMETFNASQLVSQGLDRLTSIDEESLTESTQLLPEPQKLDRESSVAKIAQMMQGETGIEIISRKWHWKSYLNCFHGEEFTNWLMHNVRNMNTREDAVEFGNQMMKEGLFEHVNGRHHFKDGHYFYSIKREYRAPRIDVQKSKSVHNRPIDKSVPPTPMSERPMELSPPNVRTRSGSNIAQQLSSPISSSEKHTTSESQLFSEKRRKVVSLSRMIQVNVDPRNRSFLGRHEVVNVHYDRFHNPENCYHIELDWLSTTCKLVDDAITSWTSTADRYGLKLVEVPIAEASDVPIAEPFRNPYRIKLALEPPKEKLTNPTFNLTLYSATLLTSHQLASAPTGEKHIYQKAILKRSNFVLDLEAISEFPEAVDVRYSWGQLNYKYTQYIHRSGVILAQIMENGDIVLLANRLYNSRVVNTKEAGRMFDLKKDTGPQSHRPPVPPTAAASMQASGIVGINLASPSTGSTLSPGINAMSNLASVASPGFRPTSSMTTVTSAPTDPEKPIIADSFGPQSTFAATGLWNTLITPEQIKDDLEAFCSDKSRLQAFYNEVATTPIPASNPNDGPGMGSRKATGSSSSSLLRPFKEVPGAFTTDITGIPAFELPEPLTAAQQLRRATVMYDSASEMLEQNQPGSRNGSIGSAGNGSGKDKENNNKGGTKNGTMSPLRKNSKEE